MKEFRNFIFLLTMLFIVLKVLNVISWSWFWLLLPLITVYIIGLIILLLRVLLKDKVKKNVRHHISKNKKRVL